MDLLSGLNPDSEVPLYRQLTDSIRNLILSGRLAPGEKLPATRELAGMLKVNRTTVSAAYALLEKEGLIAGHVGRGSFVTGGHYPLPAGGLDWDEVFPLHEGLAAPPVVSGSRDGELISFATSRPSEQLFPLEAFRQTCREVVESDGVAGILQLGSPCGYEPLRQYLLDEARRGGVARASDDILITNGCQQAMDLLERTLARPGDTVILEDPVYPGLKNIFSRSGARLLGVQVGQEGMDVEALERLLPAERPRLVVVTPDFQNPTGTTLPPEARKSILKKVRAAGTVLIENDIYGHLRYDGSPFPRIKQLDEFGDTVYLGSFSKVAFPGLRVGWIIGPKPLIGRLAEAKQSSDLHTDQLSQAIMLRFAQSGRLAAHLEHVVAAGAESLASALEACEKHLPPGSYHTRPKGGMNMWLRLPEPLDAGELLPRAHRENVSYLPGRYFAVSHRDPGGLRLSFGGLSPAKIREGIAILGRIFSEELQETQARRRYAPALAMV